VTVQQVGRLPGTAAHVDDAAVVDSVCMWQQLNCEHVLQARRCSLDYHLCTFLRARSCASVREH
jgi:hypothetical protein